MSGEDDVARRCSICGLDWPDTKDYKKCPVCLDETSRCRDEGSMPLEEAERLKANAEFERYYADHCAKKGQEVDGPLPLTEEEKAKTYARSTRS